MSSNLTNFIVCCPHCSQPILIEQLNCGIFRHAMMKSTGQQIDPHSPKPVCDSLVENNQIYGCGKPFKITMEGTVPRIEVCEYI